MMIIQAHRRRGILLHPQSRLALLGQKSFHRSAARSCRALLHACCWLALLLCSSLLLHAAALLVSLSRSQLTHPLFTLLFHSLASLAVLHTHYHGILSSPLSSPSFSLSPADTDRDNTTISPATPQHLLLPVPFFVARLARPAYRSTHRIPPSPF